MVFELMKDSLGFCDARQWNPRHRRSHTSIALTNGRFLLADQGPRYCSGSTTSAFTCPRLPQPQGPRTTPRSFFGPIRMPTFTDHQVNVGACKHNRVTLPLIGRSPSVVSMSRSPSIKASDLLFLSGGGMISSGSVFHCGEGTGVTFASPVYRAFYAPTLPLLRSDNRVGGPGRQLSKAHPIRGVTTGL